MALKALMIGVGHFPPERKIVGPALPEPEWTTLDINPECKPDILFDMDRLEAEDAFFPGQYNVRIHTNYGPNIEPESFDEIHIYQTLEHFGRQGDYKGLFATFREFWRILKPGGTLTGDTPAHGSRWAWGDPGHTRIITKESLTFLTKKAYEGLGTTTSTDYRRFVHPNWWLILYSAEEGDRHGFVLKKSE